MPADPTDDLVRRMADALHNEPRRARVQRQLRHLFTPGDWTGRFEPSDRLLDSPLFAIWPEVGHRLLCAVTGHVDNSYGSCCWCQAPVVGEGNDAR